jgi:hypothetical protein
LEDKAAFGGFLQEVAFGHSGEILRKHFFL